MKRLVVATAVAVCFTTSLLAQAITLPAAAAGVFWLGLRFGCQGFSLGNGSTYLSSNGITAQTGPF